MGDEGGGGQQPRSFGGGGKLGKKAAQFEPSSFLHVVGVVAEEGEKVRLVRRLSERCQRATSSEVSLSQPGRHSG
jgi:hypothetical protein